MLWLLQSRAGFAWESPWVSLFDRVTRTWSDPGTVLGPWITEVKDTLPLKILKTGNVTQVSESVNLPCLLNHSIVGEQRFCLCKFIIWIFESPCPYQSCRDLLNPQELQNFFFCKKGNMRFSGWFWECVRAKMGSWGFRPGLQGYEGINLTETCILSSQTWVSFLLISWHW